VRIRQLDLLISKLSFMRIGLFSDMYMPHISGITHHVQLYKKYFEEQGHEVLLFTFGDYDHVDDEPNIIRTRGLEWGETGWSVAPQFSHEAKELISTLDIAHAHHPFQSGRLVAHLTAKHDIPLVFTNHTRYDLYSDAYVSYVPHNIRYRYIRLALSHALNQCDAVITPSQSIAQWLADFVQYRDATVIPNGINIDRFAHPTTQLTRQEVGLEDDAFVFCYAGRIAPEKNTLYLLDEFALVAQELPDVQLLIIGDGPDFDKLQQAIEENNLQDKVVCAGMQPYEILPAYEQLADVFVTGSISEVHPLVVLEAMAAGLPVVAIDSPGIRETVQQNINGLLATHIAPRALADNMLEFAGDAMLMQKLKEGTRKSIQQYTLPKTAGKVLKMYEQLVGG